MLIKEITHETITLNVDHLQFRDEKEIFTQNICLINIASELSLINKICQDIKSPFQANTDIILKAIDAILKNRSFTESELLEYFESQQLLRKFQDSTYKIIDYNTIYTPYEVELHILGFSLRDYLNLSSEQKEEINTAYADILSEEEENDPKALISKAKELIAKFEK